MKIKRQINLKPLKKPQALKKRPIKNLKNKQIYKMRKIRRSPRKAPTKSKISSNLHKRRTINKKISLMSRVTLPLASLF